MSFSANGSSLVAGLADGTVLVFDTSKAGAKLLPIPKLANEQLDFHWTALAGDNAVQAHQAIGALVAAPKQSVRFFQGRLKSIAAMDQGKVDRWIADLDSEAFAIRQAATKALEKVGEQIEPAIQEALKGSISLETRRRLEQILKDLVDVPGPEPQCEPSERSWCWSGSALPKPKPSWKR